MVSSTVANSTVGGVAPPRATFSVVLSAFSLKPALRLLTVLLLLISLLMVPLSLVSSMESLRPLLSTALLM